MPIVIPVPGHDLPGVLTYRDLDDVELVVCCCRNDLFGGLALIVGANLDSDVDAEAPEFLGHRGILRERIKSRRG
jgi:nitrite reductase (NADH) large subunit